MSKAPKVWLVRAGAHGEDEETALTEGLALISFRDATDLLAYHSIEDAIDVLRKADTDQNEARAANRARQLWAFSRYAEAGDTVVMPLKTKPGQIALGRIEGPYVYTKVGEDMRHTRKVNWLLPSIPRSTFKQDLLHSFGAFMTVCRVQRNDAESRVAAVFQGLPDPGFVGSLDKESLVTEPVLVPEADAQLDLAQAAHDDIVAYVRDRFQSHDLARLVAAVLEAEGYSVHVSPAGPDGGADILAGRGPLGLDSPTLCVQVKATEAPSDVKTFRELVGTMDTFKADHGLLVCWGGFNRALEREARQKIFRVRLWDQSDVVNAVYRTYEKLSPELQSELPLKRVWMRVREETGAE